LSRSNETAGGYRRQWAARTPGRRRIGVFRLKWRAEPREDLPVDRGEETVMFVRVVRFTDVNAERIESLVARIDETGPPPGVAITKLQLVFDEAQGTAVVLQYFDNEEDLRAGAETFAAMDPSDTPGSRASVDTGELKGRARGLNRRRGASTGDQVVAGSDACIVSPESGRSCSRSTRGDGRAWCGIARLRFA
jgi:hypothetical protein